MTKFLKTVLATGLLGAAVMGTSAYAQSAEFEFSVEPASLTNDLEVRTAYARLQSEAQRYCEALSLPTLQIETDCRVDVVEHVVEATGIEALQAVHETVNEGEQRLASLGGY